MKALGLQRHSKKGEKMNKVLKAYQEKLITFFKSTRKTSWGKNELISQLQDLYIEHLENVVNILDGNPMITTRNNSDQ